MLLEELGLVGNCQIASLISGHGSVVWACMPRFDSEPVFASLLDAEDGGEFSIAPPNGARGSQRYLANTNILETRFDSGEGSFRVLDFAPRFSLYDRTFRPAQLIRIIEPIDGHPTVAIECKPRLGWSKKVPKTQLGSNHIRYLGFDAELRLTTDVPLSYLDKHPFVLNGRKYMVLSWGAPVEEPLAPMCDRFLSETQHYWERWVKQCNVPALYQKEVIRSALALKLHCFEDTGAIAAALTTSLPESPRSGRTWDYRYCWLRDAFYALNAFRLLGHFDEREKFIEFLLNIAASAPNLDLAPLYRIDGTSDLHERTLSDWPGYEDNGPVRVGNAAALHKQHDVYGEMVLALSRVFFDDRFERERTPAVWSLLLRLTRKAISLAGKPDAGIWEYRTEWVPQAFSSLMCWAAADRASRIAAIEQPEVREELENAARHIKQEILSRAWNAERGSLVGSYDGRDLDAALLQAAPLRFLDADDPRLHSTVNAIQRDLDRNGWLLRYRADDGFGTPDVAFVLCTFWLVEALCVIGQIDEARKVMARVCGSLSSLNLISEDFDPNARRMWGNFPQAYSHVGLIHAAFAASPPWSEIL